MLKKHVGETCIQGRPVLSGEAAAEVNPEGEAIQKFFGAPAGEAFGFVAGSPAAVGMVMADTCVKSGDVDILRYLDADHGTSHTNEVIVAFTGDASAVKSAVMAARRVGLELLKALGSEGVPVGTPYLR